MPGLVLGTRNTKMLPHGPYGIVKIHIYKKNYKAWLWDKYRYIVYPKNREQNRESSRGENRAENEFTKGFKRKIMTHKWDGEMIHEWEGEMRIVYVQTWATEAKWEISGIVKDKEGDTHMVDASQNTEPFWGKQWKPVSQLHFFSSLFGGIFSSFKNEYMFVEHNKYIYYGDLVCTYCILILFISPSLLPPISTHL